MLVLPVFPQDEPPTTGDTTEVSNIADLIAKAEQGDPSSQYVLGLLYEHGAAQGVPQDYKEAVRWYRAAAEQGDSRSQNNLGNNYRRGEGVPQDYIQAHLWYNLAASDLTGDDRETAAKNRDSLAEEMTSEQIAEA